MSLFEDAMSVAVQLPLAERERLARALGLNVHTRGPGKTLPLNQFVNAPDLSKTDPAAWRKAETGHAVLNTGASTAADETAQGPAALRGIWAGHDELPAVESLPQVASASTLRRNSPAIIHTDLCFALAMGDEAAARFFETPPVEIRLATATYLALLGAAQDDSQMRRLQRFVAPYAVLSLGPMASSRAVELMISQAIQSGLQPLDALIAATALAHEIPVVARDPRPFVGIGELEVCRV